MIQKTEFNLKEILNMIKRTFDKFKKIVSSYNKDIILIALCGGSSVGDFYQEIGKRMQELPYKKLKFFMLDERFNKNERNFNLVKTKIIENLSKTIKNEMKNNFYEISGKSIEEATINYEKSLKKLNPELVFDIIIASSGEDCHIGSLFPQNKLLNDKRRGYGFILDSSKLPKERITLLPESIINSEFAFLFFIGKKKEKAYDFFLNNHDTENCPANFLKKLNLEIVTDIK